MRRRTTAPPLAAATLSVALFVLVMTWSGSRPEPREGEPRRPRRRSYAAGMARTQVSEVLARPFAPAHGVVARRLVPYRVVEYPFSQN
jgi:hypothetical protein